MRVSYRHYGTFISIIILDLQLFDKDDMRCFAVIDPDYMRVNLEMSHGNADCDRWCDGQCRT